MNFQKSTSARAILIAAFSILFPIAVNAQNANDEIIITGKRTKLQKTPIAVSRLSQSDLQNGQIKKAQDLIQIVPSLQFPQSESALSVTARIRGIGTQGTNVGLEPSVGIMIDGVLRSRTAIGFGDLGELAGLEIARGPQSTLYAGNVSAGLIYIETKKPSQEFSADSFLSIGNLNYQNWGASVNGALSQSLSGRIYFSAAKRDGYMIVNQGLPNERRDNNINYYTSRGQLFFENGAFNARLIADYSSRNETCCNAPTYVSDSRIPVNSTAIINRIFASGKYIGNQFSDLKSYADRPFDQSVLDKGISLEINHDFNGLKFKSLTSSRYFDFAYAQDGEWSGADILYRDIALDPGAKVKDFSQEFRLFGKNVKLDWSSGIVLSHQEINSHNVFQYGKDYETYIGGLLSGASAATIPVSQYTINLRNLIFGATGGAYDLNTIAMVQNGGWSDYFAQKANNYSAFGRIDYAITSATHIIAGARFIHDEKDYSANFNTTGANGCAAIEKAYGLNPSALAPSSLAGVVGTVCVPWARSALDGKTYYQNFKDDNWAGNVSIRQDLGQNFTGYLNYSRGVKSGGFNLDRVMQDKGGSIISGPIGAQIIRAPDTSFEAETVDAYELGLKGNVLKGDLQFSVAIFKQDFKNFQLNTYNGISQIVASVPKVNSQGFEYDYSYKAPIKGLKLRGGLAFADTKYGRNLGAPNDTNSFLGQNLNLYLIAGQQLTASPKWTVTNQIDFDRQIYGLLWGFNLNHRHTSSFNGGSNLDVRKTTKEMDLFNGQITISNANSDWSVALWGKNLGDKHYAQIYFDGPLQGNSPLMSTSGTTRAITSQIDGFPAEPRTYGITLRLRK